VFLGGEKQSEGRWFDPTLSQLVGGVAQSGERQTEENHIFPNKKIPK